MNLPEVTYNQLKRRDLVDNSLFHPLLLEQDNPFYIFSFVIRRDASGTEKFSLGVNDENSNTRINIKYLHFMTKKPVKSRLQMARIDYVSIRSICNNLKDIK